MLSLLLALVPLGVWSAHRIAPQQAERVLLPSDGAFLAFYCAGKVASHHADPYRVEPLLTCEHEADVPSFMLPAGVVEPAPLPGYALAFFSAFRSLPFVTAALWWATLLMMALVVATWALARSTGLPWYVVAATLAPTAGLVNVIQGELPPLVIGALSLSGLMLVRRRYTAAALAASAAMLEPHVGLAACLGLFVFERRTRPALLGVAVVLALVSLASLGLGGNLEYIFKALPDQARSEFHAPDQFSLMWALHALGVSHDASLRAGSLSYIAMLGVGLTLARRWASTLRSPELLVLVPAAAVLLGGVYIHDIQMVCALPAALIIAARRAAYSPLAFVAVTLIAIPWGPHESRFLTGLSVVTIAVLALYGGFGRSRIRRLASLAAGAGVILAVSLFFSHGAPAHVVNTAPAYEPHALASANWREFVLAQRRPVDAADVVSRILVWSGFVALALAATLRSTRKPGTGRGLATSAAAARSRPDVSVVPSAG